MTSRGKPPALPAPPGHREEHRGLVDFLGDPVPRAVERRGPGHPPVELTEEQAQAAAAALRARMPETAIARRLGVNYRTWMRIREDDDRVADAVAEGRKLEEEELAGMLLDRARRETVALIFALKSRHGYRDQGAPPGDGGSRTNIVINLPASMSPDEYSRLIDVTPTELTGEKSKKGGVA